MAGIKQVDNRSMVLSTLGGFCEQAALNFDLQIKIYFLDS